MPAALLNALGAIHTGSAVVALLAGTMALLRPGFGRAHRRWGYVYVAAMAVMLATAFSLYRMFGAWGPFHYLAVVSSATLLGGMVPLWLRRPRGSYRVWHLAFMFWSLAGLYAALVAETGTRVLPELGWSFVIGGTVAVMAVANVLYRRRLADWTAIARTPQS